MSTDKTYFFVIAVVFSFFEIVSAGQKEPSRDPHLSWADNLVHDCAALSGEYNSVGRSSIPNAAGHEPPRLEKAIFGIEGLDREAASVLIEQIATTSMNVFVNDDSGNLLLSRLFNSPYVCDGPWAVYESTARGSGDGSSVIRTFTVTKLARSVDRSLIAFVSETSVIRDWLFFRKTERFETWYHFVGTDSRDNELNLQ